MTGGSGGLGVRLPKFLVVGGQLVGGHPVGIDYNPTPRNHLRPEFAQIPSSAVAVGALLLEGRVECTSCHAVRAEDAIPDTALIRREFRQLGETCTACHALD